HTYSISLKFVVSKNSIEATPMTTASPPAPSAQVLFFSRLHRLQPTRTRTGRISTWPFKVARDRSHDEGREGKDDIRAQAARVIRTTAESWWPPKS
ncbi:MULTISPECIES: hypothetical protein, partial [unclassified Variovorax]